MTEREYNAMVEEAAKSIVVHMGLNLRVKQQSLMSAMRFIDNENLSLNPEDFVSDVFTHAYDLLEVGITELRKQNIFGPLIDEQIDGKELTDKEIEFQEKCIEDFDEEKWLRGLRIKIPKGEKK